MFILDYFVGVTGSPFFAVAVIFSVLAFVLSYLAILLDRQIRKQKIYSPFR